MPYIIAIVLFVLFIVGACSHDSDNCVDQHSSGGGASAYVCTAPDGTQYAKYQ